MRIAEHFYSLQGEGPATGFPAVFLRLAGCNLVCGGKETVKTGQLHDGATWRCDTIETWSHGESTEVKAAVELFCREQYLSQLCRGAHLVITGGEPLMQQDELSQLIRILDVECGCAPYIEVETNGTILPEPALLTRVNQWNVSPKLRNSGMPEERRINGDALRCFAALDNAYFKFVVTEEADAAEAGEEFVQKFGIPPHRVFLMPGAATRAALTALFPSVAELCKQRGWRLSGRLQLEIWDQAVGV
jgi:6-pyruvoyltetrahydropterin 2'-reductase